MTEPTVRPDTIARLRDQAELALAMLAGMQLDVFSPLENGLLSLEAVAESLEVRPEKLQALMYALVAAGLLENQGEGFANTAESAKFLVKGRPEYMGAVSGNLAFRWDAISKTAESSRTGAPQAKQSFAEGDHDALEQFLRGIQGEAAKSGRELAENWDFTGVGAPWRTSVADRVASRWR